MKIIGISGTNGSGKDSLGKMLEDRHGYSFVSVTEILRDGLRKKNLPIERENMRNLSAQWRREHGLGVLIDKAVEMFKSSGDKYKGLAISSLRNPGEADRVHELGGEVVWLDADPKERYERIHSRHRSTEDQKTYEQFLSEEQAEMEHKGDEATLSMAGVKAKADIFIRNDGNKVEEFTARAEKALNKHYLI
jgi:dephospho-CoA kinase